MTRNNRNVLAAICLSLTGITAFGQAASGATGGVSLPLTAVSLYSSGVGYFSREGTVSGNGTLELEFDVGAVNDVLKSLVVRDPNTAGFSVSYDAEDTLERTLQSLSVDLSGAPSLGEILASLRGESVTVSVPERVEGRILGSERVQTDKGEVWRVSLVTASGIRRISLEEIETLSFSDPALSGDLERALDVLANGAGGGLRKVRISLPGTGTRTVSIGYVVPVPVWKAAYRLDLGRDKPFFQGWAIVDNAGSSDWKAVRLSLMNGKPVSFIQNLYNPFYINRPVVPLSIAGYAEALTYDSGFGSTMDAAAAPEYAYEEMAMSAPAPAAKAMRSVTMAESATPGSAGNVASARSAGELFEFTLPALVSLDRRQSTMLPIVETEIAGERVSVFSGSGAIGGGTVHPMLSVRLKNTSGMKLPAGPVTVFDAGTYAGDALLEFLPENETRLLAYGEDTAVSGWAELRSTREFSSVKVAKGTMTIMRKNIATTTYTLKNASSRSRTLVLEHPVTRGATLALPQSYAERTDSLYRFTVTLPSGGEVAFPVSEETPVSETVAINRLKGDSFVYYSSSRELPENVRNAIAKAAEFRKRVDVAQAALDGLISSREELVAEQERIRLNLAAAGNGTQQGKEYLKKLTASDDEIASLDDQLVKARKSFADAESAYEAYLAGMNL